MKYDIITELHAKGLIDALNFEEQGALRKMIKGIDHGPNSVEYDKNNGYGLIKNDTDLTYLSISNNGRKILRASDPRNDVKNQASVELIPAGLCNFTVTKFDKTGFRIMNFKTSIRASHVYNQLEIKYYDYEATTCCGKNKLGEPVQELFEFSGIIPDEEELIQLPDGAKGRDEIIDYINIALRNPNNSYSEVAKKMVENKRIGATSDDDTVIFLDDNDNIEINRNNNILIKKFVL